MLPAANRLRTATDFSEATRRGHKAARGSVVLYLKPSADSGCSFPPARVGVITSKAVGGSVSRHRAARRIRAAVRPHLADLPPGSVLVVRALPGADRDRALSADVAMCVQRLTSS